MVETRVVDASVQVESGFLSLFKPETFFIRISECGKSERESARERERDGVEDSDAGSRLESSCMLFTLRNMLP